MLGTPDWAVMKTRGKLGFSEADAFLQIRSQRVGRRLERGFESGRLLDVIGTDIETIIATEHAVPEFAAKFIIDRLPASGQFNGEVRNAASSVNHIRLTDGARRAGADAQRTRSA